MMRSNKAVRWASGMTLAVAIAASAPAMSEEGAVKAYSTWKARGQIFPTGTREATFVGALSGTLYVEFSDGSFDTGLISCPGTVVIDTQSTAQKADAKCVIATPDGDRIYAEFSCTGEYLTGCNGDFKFVGGTGAKQNISGGGPIKLKSGFAALSGIPGSIIDQSSVGLAVWPELTYKLP